MEEGDEEEEEEEEENGYLSNCFFNNDNAKTWKHISQHTKNGLKYHSTFTTFLIIATVISDYSSILR